MENVKLGEIFDHAFREVSKKIIKLELQEETKEGEGKHRKYMEEGYREEIKTHGFLDSKIVCRFSEGLYYYIVSTMNNGVTPSEDQIPLFLNEYINIACGCAVSNLNNLVGKPSRLSVPRFYSGNEPLDGVQTEAPKDCLAYHTSEGLLHVFLFYSLQKG